MSSPVIPKVEHTSFRTNPKLYRGLGTMSAADDAKAEATARTAACCVRPKSAMASVV